tara:strand:- start:6182 stop:7471 length:1290 start_codon:yes stop_codon:yes gene_type:complete
MSFLILPITQATDLFWVGRMNEALAIAGQAATNQIYSTVSMVTSTIPTILAPRVAKAYAANDMEEVQQAVGESLVMSASIGAVLTLIFWRSHRGALLALGGASSLAFSVPYLLSRLPGLVFEGATIVSFAAFRGMMDTVTPLRVSAISNLANVVLDPLLIFTLGMGIAGAGVATTASQVLAAALYVGLMLRRRMLRWSALRLPSWASLRALAAAGGAVQLRSVALNIAFFGITRAVQTLDATGTAAAAHSITLQLWQLGGVILFALSTVASILVPSELNRPGGGVVAARAAASRMLSWGVMLGALLGALQLAALPMLGVFSPLPEVQRAARLPSIMGAFLQLINGVTFIGEGVMVGTQSFTLLAATQVVATAAMLLALRLIPRSLNAVWACFFLFNGIRLGGVLWHYFVSGPLVPGAGGGGAEHDGKHA